MASRAHERRGESTRKPGPPCETPQPASRVQAEAVCTQPPLGRDFVTSRPTPAKATQDFH